MQTPVLFLHDDAKILDALDRGDENALLELFHKNRRPIAALVRQHHGSQDDADDVLQEALVILWERVRNNTFAYEAKLSTFIYAAAKHLLLRRIARKRHEVELKDETPLEDTETHSPLEAMIETEGAAAVEQAMHRIGRPCKDVLFMFYWEERSMDDIARQLGFANAATVKAKKYQCKKALETLVKKILS